MEVSALLAFADGDAWHLGIGDPTFMGWFTVLAYFVTGALCLREMINTALVADQRKVFWGVLTVLLFLLGINKQLDLQTWLTLTVRKLAIAEGWYDQRRLVQGIFVLMIAVLGAFSALLMAGLVKRSSNLRLPLLGFVLLIVFVVVRAASFHHVDQLINLHIAGMRLNWVLEIGAITIIALGTLKGSKGKDADETPSGPWVGAR